MLQLRGSSARSSFRLEKLLTSLKQRVLEIEKVSAEFVYFVDAKESLTKTQQEKLAQLLDAQLMRPGFPPSGELFWIVVPRPGTISPWCSKATDIAHNCGLAAIRRIERGIVYYLGVAKPLESYRQATIKPLLYDPMTEAVLDVDEDPSRLFIQTEPAPLEIIPLRQGGWQSLAAANSRLGLALSEQEMHYLVEHFMRLNRDPSDVELMMFAQANSEHCRHKIFNAAWVIDGKPQQVSLFDMIRHTHQQTPGGVLSAYHDNAAVMKGWRAARFFPDGQDQRYRYHKEDVHILMKVETHNHPTAISPFPGAATGSGGEIRDEGATGRGAKPKAGLTGFSVSNLHIPDYKQPWEIAQGCPSHMASALAIMLEGPIGAAAFNNEFGRPNLIGYFRTFEEETPDGELRGYHKPIMIAGGLGNIRAEHVHKAAIPVATPIVVIGGPAMLIGLGGGAASSMTAGSSREDLDFASVQRGNPEMQRRCQEVIDRCWALGSGNPILSIHDVGAGGLSNALPELINDAGRGGHFELRNVPNDAPGMSPREIWCNEAQERYVLAIAREHLAVFQALCERERCPWVVLGCTTEEQQLRVDDRHFANRPIQMPLEVLLGKPPRMQRQVNRVSPVRQPFDSLRIDLKEAVQRVLRLPTVADKSFLITIGDRTVGGLVARDQMVGPWQVPVADVAVTASGFTSYHGEAMAMGERTPVAILDGPASGRMAVGEAITNIAAAAIADLSAVCLSANWMAAAGHPGEDAVLFDTVRAVAWELCPTLGLSIPVGKDSLSMQTVWRQHEKQQQVTAPLSLIVSAFAPVYDVRATMTPQLRTDQGPSELLLLDLGHGKHRLGGSALAQVFNQLGEIPPDLEKPRELSAFFEVIQKLNADGQILAYHDRSDGGLLVTLCEMLFAGGVGVTVSLDTLGDDPLAILFSEELGAVIQIRSNERKKVLQALKAAGLEDCSHVLGSLNDTDRLTITYQDKTLLDEKRVTLRRLWSETSYRMQSLRDNPSCAQEAFEALLDENDPGLNVQLTFAPDDDIAAPFIAQGERPQVAVLREQGINGQLEMAAAFEQAGFAAFDVHMSDLAEGRVSLKNFQGMVACGGFSYGDVLGAGQGWAKSILFNGRLRDEFADFFARENSFGLGVCNGCQLFSGLCELIPGADLWPHFVTNRVEQFEARLVSVEVLPTPSLFFANMAGSRLPVPVAHGEGRISYTMNDHFAELQASSLVALRYVDNAGRPAETYPANPNGSFQGITGLTNQDGRFTIMMPHPERVFRSVQFSWHPQGWSEYSPWLRLFRNARVWLG